MRRSLAPSVIKSNLKSDGGNNNETNNHNNSSRSLSSLPLNNENSNNDEMIIKQMPLFGFLSIPEGLAKQFTIPTGCLVTKESLELRKCRSLGAKRLFKRITPADLNSSLPRPTVMVPMLAEEGEEEEEMGVCTSAIPPHEPLVLWTDPQDETNTVEVIPELCHRLRPHQREGVQFLFECTMGLRGFEGQGCILADDMGLGKTFMSVTLLWTLMNQSFEKGVPAAKKVIVVCPTSLVGNWDNEIRKWVGEKCPTFPVKSDGKKMIQSFISHRGKGVLIVSYETQRRFCKMFEPSKQNSSSVCDLLICDEAHKLKNADSGLSKSLNLLPVRRRVLLSGTPMQNELTEFYNMVNFCNPGVIGTTADFRRQYERPILAARELGASDTEIAKAGILQKQLSTIVNEFILKRGNILNARHLPPKLVQFVCCRLSSVQTQIYEAVLNSKEARHIRDGKQLDTLATLRQLINVCSHPKLVLEGLKSGVDEATGVMKEDSKALFDLLNRLGVAKSRPPQQQRPGGGPSRITSSSSGTATSLGLHNSGSDWVDAELSGKLFVLCRMMQVMRAQKRGERIVIVSNYTQTLDLIESLCGQNQWPFLRLDGTTAGATRTKLVDRFNDPHSGQFAFLLSSKAGGCGINLIGGSRLVLFDPDWNPASDKQAAGRIWREGQQRRCFIYRFMSTNTVEEKIIQRQLSKEGLQNIVDDTDQVNTFSTEELKRLFVRREDDTRSDTHDTLRCKRCRNVFLTTTGCGASADKNKLVPSQIELCSQFIRDFYAFLTETVRVAEVEKSFEDLLSLCDDLQNGVFTTLPLFSRKLRSVLSGIEKELTEESLIRKLFSNGATLSSEFVDRWSDVVPTLTRLGKEYQKSLTASQRSLSDQGSNDDEDDEDASPDDEWVEQEGCPDESDFNK